LGGSGNGAVGGRGVAGAAVSRWVSRKRDPASGTDWPCVGETAAPKLRESSTGLKILDLLTLLTTTRTPPPPPQERIDGAHTGLISAAAKESFGLKQ
jgi:hypothetical protein